MLHGMAMVVLLCLCGCGTANHLSAPWTAISESGPWCAASERAVLQSREYWSGMMASAVSSDKRFLAPDGRSINAQRVITSLINFLEKKGAFRAWLKTNGSINGRPVFLAPYRFHLVSVFPSIVILSSQDFGAIQNRSNYDLVCEIPKGALRDDRILNYIETDASIPSHSDLYWCSADLGVPITKIQIDAHGGFKIQGYGLVITGKKEGDRFLVERIK